MDALREMYGVTGAELVGYFNPLAQAHGLDMIKESEIDDVVTGL